MSRRPLDRADLTDAWPDDPANDDLARTAADLFAASPALPQIALDRIQVQMRAEMIRLDRLRLFRKLIFVTLATLALAAGVWLAVNRSRRAAPTSEKPQPAPASVHDRFQVTLPPTSPKSPEKPLLDPAKDADLFGKGAKR
jgi:hypothetical protein